MLASRGQRLNKGGDDATRNPAVRRSAGQSSPTVRRDWWVPTVGLAAVAVYVALTLVAVSLYPGGPSPADVYLSDLGNADYSPDGWAFFDLAMVLGGLLSILFFVGLYGRYRAQAPRRWLKTGLAAGIVNGVAVVMAGVVAEHVHLGVHIGWSLLIFASFLPLLVAYGVVLWRSGVFSRVVAIYGFAVCLADIGLLSALFAGGAEPGGGSVMEWVAVFGYLAWVALVSVGMASRPPWSR